MVERSWEKMQRLLQPVPSNGIECFPIMCKIAKGVNPNFTADLDCLAND
jgi:hypothetical protein